MKNFTKAASADSSIPRIKRVLELINAHLYSVEERIRSQAKAFDPAVEGYIAYACESNGKRLRPALALLAGGATGNISSSHLDLAVVIELIHAATLVHDDIMDGADLRRGQPTVNAKWGSALTVLLGDALFAHALKLSTSFSNNEVSRRIADAALDVCTGEIIQTQRRFDLTLPVMEYHRIIEMKTAALFSSAAELGAFLNDATPEVISAMKVFGQKLGNAYQVYDDCLDIAGNEEEVGKSLGTDLQKGKLTLPMILLLKGAGDEDREVYGEAIMRGRVEDAACLREAAVSQGAFAQAVTAGRQLLKDASAQLRVVPSNRYSAGLAEICTSLDEMLAAYSA